MPYRLLFTSYTADLTGPTTSLMLLLKYLRERHDVAVLLPGRGLFSEQLEEDGIRYHTMPDLRKGRIPAIWKLIRQEGFDLVYGNNTSGASRNAMLAAKLAGKPFICHIREMGWGQSWKTLGYLRLADAIIAVSQACAESVARFVSRKRLHVVYNGVPPATSPLTRDAARAALLAETGLSADDVIISYVAHICERKGQKYAVKAMADVAAAVPNARLLLIGSLDREPDYVREIRQMIADQHLENHVLMPGFQKNALQWVQGADLFIHTANREPHPRSVIEAMNAGLAGVGFAVDGVAETIVHDQTGYLVAKNDTVRLAEAMIKLIQTPSLRQAMGSAGRQRVEARFSASATANQIGQIIDNLMGAAA